MPRALLGRSVFIFALLGAACFSAQISSWREKFDTGIKALNEGRYQDAHAFLQAAYDEAQTLKADGPARARAAFGLGSLHEAQAHLQEAERLFLEAKTILESSGGPAGQLAVVWTGLGEIWTDQGRVEEAEKAIRQAMSLAERDPQSGLLTYLCRRHLGEIHILKKDFSGAEDLLSKLLADERTSNPDKVLLATTLLALGHVYMLSNRLSEAEPLIKEAMALQGEAGGQSPSFADSMVAASALYRLRGSLERAEPLLRKALKIYETAGDPRIAFAYAELGKVAAAEGKYLVARQYLEKSLEVGRQAPLSELAMAQFERELQAVSTAQARAGKHRSGKALAVSVRDR